MKQFIQVDGSENLLCRQMAEPSQTCKHNVGEFRVLIQHPKTSSVGFKPIYLFKLYRVVQFAVNQPIGRGKSNIGLLLQTNHTVTASPHIFILSCHCDFGV